MKGFVAILALLYFSILGYSFFDALWKIVKTICKYFLTCVKCHDTLASK